MKTYIVRIVVAGCLLLPAVFAEDKVDARRQMQQDRIAQGVKSGQLSAKETAHLENKEHKLNQEIHAERKANGGKLTVQERKQVNRQQNHISGQIYNDKHNSQTQPK
jgi:hypothetical protein